MNPNAGTCKMDVDDKIRAPLGVVVCLRDMGDGTSRLFFDDVKADKTENPISWRHDYFFTFTPEMDDETLNMMALDDSEYQKIGEAVVARLLALNNRVE